MFADSATCADAQSKFAHMKLDVLDGLQAALAAIDVAESQGSGFDLLQLMAKAEEAWGKIYKFLNDLGLPLASSLPEAKDSQNLPPMMKLPNTLLPSRR
jgi:hypothetical protein